MRLIKGIHQTSTWLILAVGVIHTMGTFFFYQDISEAAMWFAGAGLGGIFVAFLNIFLWQQGCQPPSRKLIIVANALFLAWLTVGFVVTPAPPTASILIIGSLMSLSGITLAMKNQYE